MPAAMSPSASRHASSRSTTARSPSTKVTWPTRADRSTGRGRGIGSGWSSRAGGTSATDASDRRTSLERHTPQVVRLDREMEAVTFAPDLAVVRGLLVETHWPDGRHRKPEIGHRLDGLVGRVEHAQHHAV